MKIKSFIQFFTDRKYRNAEMVSYWKTKDAVEAKLVKTKEGHYVMHMEGEKYPFPGYPRGVLLYGSLSPLKHLIKNKIFNKGWEGLELGLSEWSLRDMLNGNWENIYNLIDHGKPADANSKEVKPLRYDMVPFERLNPPMKELWRAMTKVGVNQSLKEIVTFILQEDDAYRMRFQWMAKFFPRFSKPTPKHFEHALNMLEEAEMIGDMKERIRLFRRVFLFMVKDSQTFANFLKEVDWKKVGLTKADKYFFRAKYFKVDYPEYQY